MEDKLHSVPVECSWACPESVKDQSECLPGIGPSQPGVHSKNSKGPPRIVWVDLENCISTKVCRLLHPHHILCLTKSVTKCVLNQFSCQVWLDDPGMPPYLAGGRSQGLVDGGALDSLEYLQTLVERHFYQKLSNLVSHFLDFWVLATENMFYISLKNTFVFCIGLIEILSLSEIFIFFCFPSFVWSSLHSSDQLADMIS